MSRSAYPRELRERAVRMAAEIRPQYESEHAAIVAVATKLGIGTETVRKWIRRLEVDAGARPGVTTEEAAGMKRSRRENARKVWLSLNREGIPVARCVVERLMRQLGLRGASDRRPCCCRQSSGFGPSAPRPYRP